MENELLNIKEFAEKAGVSVQSVYKKLRKENNPIKRYLIEVEGVKYIKAEALSVLYGSNSGINSSGVPLREAGIEEQPPQPKEKAAPQPESSTDRLLTILEQQLEEQRRQLIEKDKLITEQNAQINSLLARLEDSSRLLDQQQQLAAAQYKKLLAAGAEAAADYEVMEQPAASSSNEDEEPAPPPKTENKGFRSFWNRITGKGE